MSEVNWNKMGIFNFTETEKPSKANCMIRVKLNDYTYWDIALNILSALRFGRKPVLAFFGKLERDAEEDAGMAVPVEEH